MTKEAIQKLEDFILQNDDLEQLESMVKGFNLFEAIAMGRQELKHSATLSFLLDPSKDHGLDTYFLKRCFMRVAQDMSNFSPIDIDCMDLSDVKIKREWQNIDILIESKQADLVIAIENKIDSTEHSNQLQKYKTIVENNFPHIENKFFIYLTKDGVSPQKETDQEVWTAFSHTIVIEELERSLSMKTRSLSDEQKMLINHYIEFMKRHILGNSEIATLAQKIYENHKEALDIIFEHKPDERAENIQYIKNKLEERDDVRMDKSSGSIIRFYSPSWNFGKVTRKGWCTGTRGILFEIGIPTSKKTTKVELVIGSRVQPNHKDCLFKTVEKRTEMRSGKKNAKWPRAWSSPTNLRLTSHEETLEDINTFFDTHYPKLCEAVKEALNTINANVDETTSSPV
ncbi:PD-(D/E)XK nuclease family protein [Terasakiella pusilla]|uniref:PDDEXK-like family protein n=1 Tax=Terasakiella pusilla TaxID=64973 RepID=UPI00048D984A|nr:PD-(D/E)XK nuclease family protein [Terasakiella pusilla]